MKNNNAVRTIVSLFDGISCGQEAVNRYGLTYDKFYASEIDTYAMRITQKNYPSTIQLGDVLNWKEWDIDWPQVDILFAGFPGQSFSIAGNQEGLDDPRGQLVHTMIEILNHCKQFNQNVQFLFENTKMKTKSFNTVNKVIGVEPTLVNSNLVSAQNRPRWYWSNLKITQPDDRKINIIDILEVHEDNITFDFSKYQPRACKNYYQFDVSGKKYNSQQDRAYYITGKIGCLPNARAVTKVKIALSDSQYRNLSLNEVESLQTLPHGYTQLNKGFSLNKSMSAIGNGWNVATIIHFLSENY